MTLSPETLKVLSALYDRWSGASATTRAHVEAEAATRGDEFLRAFKTMIRNAGNTADSGAAPDPEQLPPLSDALRDAALFAAFAGDGRATSRISTTPHPLDAPVPLRCAGQQVGPYRLIRELGRGGMGVVWLAARADGQHERQVALKMPLVENLNWLLAARFARERNILASLEHPGIARLYDAGVDEATQPYIAIEYVQGQPITTYVKEKKLAPEAIVQLFGRVIEAVAHAHAQLVIHRDIKPANILVDAKGEPHLLDFGIAKLLDDEDSEGVDATQLTRLSGRALTLDYASPEQVNNTPLGTASDVYSLGVVLYELLTGSRPYQPKGATRRDLELAILEQEPGKPSDQRLSTGDSESGKSARRMRGDLDTIVLKALRKEPKQRYATAQAFADDLKRYLAFEPILARPDRLAYRLRKLLRRQRVPLIVASVGCAAVAVVGVRALQQQQLAQASLARAQSVEGLINSIFQGMSPDVAATRLFSAKELLARAEKFLRADAAADAGGGQSSRREIQRRIAGLYAEIGANDEAITRYTTERRAASEIGDYRTEALMLTRLVEVNTILLRYDVAVPLIGELQQLLGQRIKPPDELYAMAAIAQGQFFYYQDQSGKAAEQYAAAIAFLDAAQSRSTLLRALALQGQGFAARALGDLNGARRYLAEAQTAHEKSTGQESIELLSTRSVLAAVENGLGNFAAAQTLLRDVVPAMTARLGAHHTQTLFALRSLAYVQVRTGEFNAAQTTLDLLRATPEPHRATEQTYVDLLSATMAMYRDDLTSAEALLRKTLSSVPAGTVGTARIQRILGEALMRAGRDAEAGVILRAVETLQVTILGERHPDVAVTRIVFACFLARVGELTQSRSMITKAVEVLAQERGEQHFATVVARSYLAVLEQNVSDAGMEKRLALADELQQRLAWQPTAITLAQWLRVKTTPSDWRQLPVVF